MSNGIGIYSTDFHSIYSCDKTDTVLNENRSVIVGSHVWIGVGAQILKGSKIGMNSVVGAASLVSGLFESSNQIIAGNPAKCVREHIIWSADSTNR